MMTEHERTRHLLLQMDCGLVKPGRTFRKYLTATLELQKFCSRSRERKVRRWLWCLKLTLLLTLFGALALRVLGQSDVGEMLWPILLTVGPGLGAGLLDRFKERQCRQHFECLLQLAVDQAPGTLPFPWQAGLGAECFQKFSQSLEWEMEWRLRRQEARTRFVLAVGLMFYLFLRFEGVGGSVVSSCLCGGSLG